MKRAWVFMMSVHTKYTTIWSKYRIEYMIQQIADQRRMSGCKIRGILKLIMKRHYAQYAEEKRLEDKDTNYF